MDYFVKETINGEPNAGSKARNDISDILQSLGFSPMTFDFIYNETSLKNRTLWRKIKENLKLRIEWAEMLKKIGRGDTVIVQFPVLRRPILLALAFRGVKRRGGRVVLLAHDMEILRYASRNDVNKFKKARITYEERSVLKLADKVIVHNSRMKDKMKELGYDGDKMIELGIFDYLIPDYRETSDKELRFSVAVAGNLRPHKSKYIYSLPRDTEFELYGIGFEGKETEKVHYHGAFPPEKLPMEMRAGFGLVWDGDSADTCSGTDGEYLKINNPHKTSLYLASGMPVIIWKEAALASFILQNQAGFAVGSLSEIAGMLEGMDQSTYKRMAENAKKIGEKLRNGSFTKNAIQKL